MQRFCYFNIGGLERDITHGISYDALYEIIEHVLKESDYYSMQSTHHARHISQPLAAIGHSPLRR